MYIIHIWNTGTGLPGMVRYSLMQPVITVNGNHVLCKQFPCIGAA